MFDIYLITIICKGFTNNLISENWTVAKMTMVKAQNLSYEYKRSYETASGMKEEKFIALEHINLEIKKGSFTAVLGHNGSGKSTFAKHINALLTPTEGTLWVKGYDTKNEEFIWDIRQSAGMVFQNPDNQMVATVVEEDVAFGPENMGIEPTEIRSRVDEALETVGMSDYKTHSPSRLSGGQKQRIAIAGVLAMKPDCIILDEPTAMLDPIGRKEVIDTVMRLNQQEGITIILITHYMEEAVKADNIFVIDDGSIVMSGTPREIFTQVEALKNYGLDVPQPTETAYLLRQRGIPIPDNILTVDELVQAVNSFQPKEQTVKLEQEKRSECDGRENVIEVKNLTYVYNPDTSFCKMALDHVNINIKKGEFLGLIGHTGSGKSTLIQHLNAIISPESGEILLNGKNIYEDRTKLKSVRQKVGLVFQYPEHQLFEMTVYKDVAFGPMNLGFSQIEIEKRVKKALGTVGIGEEIYEKSPFELSGGQKRRVAIAGVLAMSPEVLILDEPTAGLDPRGRDEILNAVKEMHRELGITVVLVSHSMEDVARLADRIIVMHKSKVALAGTPREIFAKGNELEKMGLASPQISYVFDKLNQIGYQMPKDIYTTARAADVLYKLLKAGEQND